MKRIRLARMAAVVAIGTALTVGTASAIPIELTWSDLIPQSALVGERVAVLEGLIQHAQVTDQPENASAAVTSIEEILGISSAIEYRDDLDGAEVSLRGYVLPLTMDGSAITYFLLVPFVGACVHVPAPPANQLVLVDFPDGFQAELWAPVEVTGILSVSGISTELAEVGYTIDASGVEGI